VRVGLGPLVCGGHEAEAVAEEAGDGYGVVQAKGAGPRLLGVRVGVRVEVRVGVRVGVRVEVKVGVRVRVRVGVGVRVS
jgi:hypothetical protein